MERVTGTPTVHVTRIVDLSERLSQWQGDDVNMVIENHFRLGRGKEGKVS
jgi:hypothetical protein